MGKLVKLLILLPAMTGAIAAFAAEPEDVIKYRRAVMKSVAGHMGAMAQIVRGRVGYTEDLPYHVESITHSMRSAGSLFPEDSDFGDTRALASVWEKPAEFSEAVEQASAAAGALLQAVQAGDSAAYGARFKDLGETCKGCHKDFREKK